MRFDDCAADRLQIRAFQRHGRGQRAGDPLSRQRPLAGDEFYDLCGPEYLKHGNKNPQAITNLARLVATRQQLDAGYQRVIWLDADVFVFDAAQLVFNFPAEHLTTGYAFGREVWLSRQRSGLLSVSPLVLIMPRHSSHRALLTSTC
jgi:hypothetical protein